jgi:hypothetical protein
LIINPKGGSRIVNVGSKEGNQMEVDWDYVKKKTLWQYEKLIAKILDVLAYNFVQEYYAHDMTEAGIYAEKIRQGYLQNEKEAEFIGEITKHFKCLSLLGIRNYRDLVERVNTKSSCEKFLKETGFSFEALIQVLNYLFRWVLPFKIPVKELLDTMSDTNTTYLEILKAQKIRSNLDVLETFRSIKGRKKFGAETRMDQAYLLELTHRADISRLAYVRGKTIMHLCGGGYNTLNRLSNVEIVKMQADMSAYYELLGKTFVDFKTVIPLDWMIGGAKVLPKIIEDEE